MRTRGDPPTFTIDNTGPTVEVIVTGARGQFAELRPRYPGYSTVTILARVHESVAAETSFSVEVRDPCPRQPKDGEDDYFPLPTVGQVLDFDYGYSVSYIDGRSSVHGEMTWTIKEVFECIQGTSTFIVQEDIHGQETSQSIYYPDTTYAVEWHRSLQIVVGDSVLIGGYSRRPFPRFQSEESPDLVEFGTKWSNARIGSDRSGSLKLERGKGIRSGSFYTHLGVGSDQSESFTIR